MRQEQEEFQQEEFQKDLERRDWSEDEIDAALAGWDYVMDNAERSESIGVSEAMDLVYSEYDGSGRLSADIYFEGICAAKKLLKTGDWGAR